jgi:hypothetical protein
MLFLFNTHIIFLTMYIYIDYILILLLLDSSIIDWCFVVSYLLENFATSFIGKFYPYWITELVLYVQIKRLVFNFYKGVKLNICISSKFIFMVYVMIFLLVRLITIFVLKYIPPCFYVMDVKVLVYYLRTLLEISWNIVNYVPSRQHELKIKE